MSNLKKLGPFPLKWLSFWLIYMGAFGLIWQGHFGLSYLNNPFFSTTYYLLGTLIGLLIFGRDSYNVILSEKRHSLFIISLLSLFIILPSNIESSWPLAPHISSIVLEKKFFFPLFDIRVSISKLSEIIFQQSLILVLVNYIYRSLKSKKETVKYFSTIFFLMHFPLVIIFDFSTALIFIVPSLIAGIVFSSSIVFLKYGVGFSYLVHLGFYLGVGILYRTDLIRYFLDI